MVKGMKVCRYCKAEKQISEYYIQRKSPDGLEYRCKECAKRQAREWRLKNVDKVLSQKKRANDRIRGKSRADIGLDTIYVESKKCSACHEIKSRDNFNKSKRSRDGLCHACRDCSRARSKKWAENNRARHAEYSKRYSKSHAEQLKRVERNRISKRKESGLRPCNARDPEKLYTCSKCGVSKPGSEFYTGYGRCNDCRHNASKEYYKNNSQKMKASASAWRKNNPEKRSASRTKRRALEYGQGDHYTYEEFEDLCNRYDRVCLRCGEKCGKMSPDHIVPLSRGGSNTIDNIQPLCFNCNMKKHTSIIDYRIQYDAAKC